MKNNKNISAWVEAGYELFASEGMEGIQVERLARILGLNKSGFYHYFGDLEGFLEELLNLHIQKLEPYFLAVRDAKTIDPDYFNILMEYKVSTLFHKNLEQLRNNPAINKVVEQLDGRESDVISSLWSKYLGSEDNPDLTDRYLIVRDMFYSRVNFKNYTFDYLQNLFNESKVVMNELTDRKNELEEDESLY